MRLALGLFMSAAVAWGQIQVTILDGTTERPLAATIDLGSTPIGAAKFTTFVIRNTGSTPVVLSVVSLSGQGFTLTSTPSLPVTLPATSGNSRFEVRFLPNASGAYSASLRVNTISTILRGTGAAEPRVALEENGARTTVQVGGRIPVGAAEIGVTLRRKFLVENPFDIAVAFRGARLTAGGSGFVLVSVPVQAELPPGTSVEIVVDFTPDRMGPITTPIEVNGRNYSLSGDGLEIPVPKPALRIEGTTTSAQQPKVVVQLAETTRVGASGLLVMEFRPSTTISTDDTGVRFTSAGTRQLGVQIRPGDRLAMLGSATEATFQTGTTAGTIVLTLTLGPHKETLSIEIARAPVKIENSKAVRRMADLDVTFTGFDNSRSVSQILFTFFDSTGRPIAPGTIRADVTADFQRYFTSSRTGTAFLLSATFPVTGPTAQIVEVEAEIVSSAGGTKTERLKLTSGL